MSHNAYLEGPYQAQLDANARYVDWCEDRGLDPNDDHEAAFEADSEDAREAHDEARAEAMAEDRRGW